MIESLSQAFYVNDSIGFLVVATQMGTILLTFASLGLIAKQSR